MKTERVILPPPSDEALKPLRVCRFYVRHESSGQWRAIKETAVETVKPGRMEGNVR